MKKQRTNNDGITLIALVITIIVLLILAGVSISLVAGENGILKKATSAVEETKKGAILEEAEIIIADWQTDYLTEKISFEGRTEKTQSGAEVMYTSGNIMVVDNISGKVYSASYSENTGLGSWSEEESLDTTSQLYKATHPEKQKLLTDENAPYEHVTGTWNTGFVIKEISTGDEFVWIPVISASNYMKKSGSRNAHISADNVENNYEDIIKYLTGDSYGSNLLVTTENEEKEIIKNAGGYYVSRYEIGIPSKVRDDKQSDANWNVLVSQQGAEPVRDITLPIALEKANNWKSDSYVQSGLITGTQWDTMCDFIGWSICDSDCSSWGNYKNSISKEYDSSMFHSGCDNLSSNVGRKAWVTGLFKVERETEIEAFNYKPLNSRIVFPTGMFVNNNGISSVQKNIYDVAGNVWELTTETVLRRGQNNYMLRGGTVNWLGEQCATYRNGGFTTSQVSEDVGFRAVLYVK